MTTEQKDCLWACLSKEAREELRQDYCTTLKEPWYCPTKGYLRGRLRVMREIFGHHNLTSDIEPKEMLIVERKKVQQKWKIANEYESLYSKAQSTPTAMAELYYNRKIMSIINSLFGDKCLPDKEEQVKPKFKVGDKVTPIKGNPDFIGKVAEVLSVNEPFACIVFDNDELFSYSVSFLEPYTEENASERKRKNEQDLSLSESQKADGMEKKGNNTEESGNKSEFPNQAKTDMEEKELNLCELLKGCEGEKFYSRAYGEVTLNEIVRDDRPNSQEIKCYTPDPQSDRIWFLRDGRKHKNGGIDLYPSEELLRKYPLDGFKAWNEWAESRKSKYRLHIDIVIDNADKSFEGSGFDFGFESLEEAQQAAEEVRKCLQKFHERKEGER